MPHSTASLFTLRNDTLHVTLTNYGARIVSILAPDRTGHQANVVLTHASLEAYEADRTSYMGATIGRFANRIAKGLFTLDGVALTNSPSTTPPTISTPARKASTAASGPQPNSPTP